VVSGSISNVTGQTRSLEMAGGRRGVTGAKQGLDWRKEAEFPRVLFHQHKTDRVDKTGKTRQRSEKKNTTEQK